MVEENDIQPVSGQSVPGEPAPERRAADREAVREVSESTAPAGDPDAPGGPDKDRDADAFEAEPDNAPITKWEDVSLDLPEVAEVDRDILDSFGKTAVALGLTPNQARALANWQLEAVAGKREALMEAGIKELSREWGSRAGANQRAVLSLISRIDRDLGDESFSTALGRSGATCHAGVVRGLLAVARLLSEDSMGKAGAGARAEHDETALEGLNNALREARRSK